jgi:hypothetical protein
MTVPTGWVSWATVHTSTVLMYEEEKIFLIRLFVSCWFGVRREAGGV